MNKSIEVHSTNTLDLDISLVDDVEKKFRLIYAKILAAGNAIATGGERRGGAQYAKIDKNILDILSSSHFTIYKKIEKSENSLTGTIAGIMIYEKNDSESTIIVCRTDDDLETYIKFHVKL